MKQSDVPCIRPGTLGLHAIVREYTHVTWFTPTLRRDLHSESYELLVFDDQKPHLHPGLGAILTSNTTGTTSVRKPILPLAVPGKNSCTVFTVPYATLDTYNLI